MNLDPSFCTLGCRTWWKERLGIQRQWGQQLASFAVLFILILMRVVSKTIYTLCRRCVLHFWGRHRIPFSKTHLCGKVKRLFPQPNFPPPPNYLAKTLFEDTFPAAEFTTATELHTEDAFRRRFCRSRISPRHRITSRRRFSKTLFPQPNVSPPPNYLAKRLFQRHFFLLKANFCPASE